VEKQANRKKSREPSRVWLWVSLFLATGLALAGCAAGPTSAATEVESVEQATDAEPSSNPKLDSSLNQLLDAHRQGGMDEAQAFAQGHGLALEADSVWVIVITAPDKVEALTDVIVGAGGQVRGHYEGHIEALIPIDELVALAGRPEVELIQQPAGAIEMSPM
jgi:hypothetical protein